MIERKYWAEGHRVEHSAKKILAECSTSFRIGLRRWPFLPIIGLLVPAACINEMDRVAAKCECFSGSFQMLRVDIPLSAKRRPLQRRRHQLHQVVHDHAPTFVGIKQGVSQPGVHAPGPLLYVQCWKRGALNLL